MTNNYLQHYGIPGMKWGVRRYQPYPNGSKRKGREVGQAAKKKAPESARSKAKKMSDAELRAAINRQQMEQQYANLNKSNVQRGAEWAKKTGGTIATAIITGIAIEQGKKFIKNKFGI